AGLSNAVEDRADLIRADFGNDVLATGLVLDQYIAGTAAVDRVGVGGGDETGHGSCPLSCTPVERHNTRASRLAQEHNAKRPHPQRRAGPLCSGGGPPGVFDVRGGACAAAWGGPNLDVGGQGEGQDRKSTRLNSSHAKI